jgi:hypothetical protein
MELEIHADTIIARLHGNTGTRLVKLPPGNWGLTRMDQNATYSAATGKWTLQHTFTDSLHNSYSGGPKQFIFVRVLKVSPKVFLQGPFVKSNTKMKDDLRAAGLIPLQEPYSAIGFIHHNSGGGEKTWQTVLNVSGNQAIVDWVFVELRSKTDASNVLATRSAFVRRDGVVVDLDGKSPVEFHNLVPDSFYVAIRHRNHLGVCSANKYMLNGTTVPVLDFTYSTFPTFGSGSGQANVHTGRKGLWAGNVNNDNIVKYTGPSNDRYPILQRVGTSTPTATVSGYFLEDVDMNGIVKFSGGTNDLAFILKNVTSSKITNTIKDKTP